MKWMLLEGISSKSRWFWQDNDKDTMVNVGEFDLSTYMQSEPGDETRSLHKIFVFPALDAQLSAIWDANTRIAAVGGKTFEVLASGRI